MGFYMVLVWFGFFINGFWAFLIPFRWPTRPGRLSERRSEDLINWMDGGGGGWTDGCHKNSVFGRVFRYQVLVLPKKKIAKNSKN